MENRDSEADKTAQHYLDPVLKTLNKQLQSINREIESLLESIPQSRDLNLASY